MIQYIDSNKQSVGSEIEVFGESLEIVFDKVHFIVNLHSFLQPLSLPRQTFCLGDSFVPHSPKQRNFQNSPPLDTSVTALVCIFSLI